MEALPVERHAGVAVQHGGAPVDVRGLAEVVVRLLPLLLPEIDLPDAVPAQTAVACAMSAMLHGATGRL